MKSSSYKRYMEKRTWELERKLIPDDADWLRFIPDNSLRPPISLGWGYEVGDEDKPTWVDRRDAVRYDFSRMGKYVPTSMDWSPNFPIDLVHVTITLCSGVVASSEVVKPSQKFAGGFESAEIKIINHKIGYTMFRVHLNGADDGGMAAEFPYTPEGERAAFALYNRVQGFETRDELLAWGFGWDG